MPSRPASDPATLRYGCAMPASDDLAQSIRAAHGSGPVDVLANYTAFQGYRKVVRDA